MMAKQADLGNQLLPTLTEVSTPMDNIEVVLEKGTEMYTCVWHAKKWNMEKKGGGATFN